MTPVLAFEIVSSLWVQIGLVVLVAIGLERWLDDAEGSCRLWTICFLSILGLGAAGLLLPHVRWAPASAFIPQRTLSSVVSLETRLVALGSGVWLVGVALGVVQRGIRCARLLLFLQKDCRPMTTQEVAALPRLATPAAPANLRWLVSDQISGPFCWQLHHPTIVVPSYVLSEPEVTLRHLLRHELEHLRTRHPLQHFLQGLCRVLFWLQPSTRWAGCRAEMAREYHCDQVAATAEGTVAMYLRTLARVAERGASPPAGCLAFGRRESAIRRRSQRLVMIASAPPAGSARRRRTAVLVMLVMVAAASQLWLPVNGLASSRSRISPWPAWTAGVLHDLGIQVRDFERFDDQLELHELFGSR